MSGGLIVVCRLFRLTLIETAACEVEVPTTDTVGGVVCASGCMLTAPVPSPEPDPA